MKVSELSFGYKLTGICDLSKMEPADKNKVLKARRFMRKVISEFDDAEKDAKEKLKPEGFDVLDEKVQSRSTMTSKEVSDYTQMFKRYNDEVESATKELGDVDVNLDYELLNEDAFLKLVDSNPKLNLSQIEKLEDILCKIE